MLNGFHPGNISIESFQYHLPEDRIAQFPVTNRDDAKLLVYKAGNISETTYTKMATVLPPAALMVFNNSRVVEARLLFQKPTGGVIEIFALEPSDQYADITTAMNQTGRIGYKCLVGGAAKWKRGIVLQKQVDDNGVLVTIEARLIDRKGDYFEIELSWTPVELSFAAILHLAGQMPIPPYLHRPSDASDTERYQTVYAKADGSVAAPTAGLHFTPNLLNDLTNHGFSLAYTTLHVGAGTFMPVKSETMQGHEMHAEFLEAHIDLMKDVADAPMVIPVGTTAMRTLESLYLMGCKVFKNSEITLEELEMQQWEVYEALLEEPVAKKDALMALVSWLEARNQKQLIIKTRILIAPGYQLGICNGLVTNFHQPQSTLLLLVSALIGDDWRKVYEYALQNDFRFLSYGDGSLLLPSQ
jgi:S-adenosylmethionine:tRNA ribosyltransferase-isomerase